MDGIGHNWLVGRRWFRIRRGENVIPVGVEATKPPLCVSYP